MANTVAATGLTPQQWDDKYFLEYIQKNRFAKYMGKSAGSMIQVKEDLTKKKGDALTFSLINRLTGNGVTGSAALEGAEEDMVSRSHALTVELYRNGVVVPEIEEQKSAIGLRNAARPVLMDWSMEHTRDLILTALASINGVAYGSASEGQKDAWLADNADRVLFGAAKSNNSGNDHSASLLNIDTTADRLTPDALSLMKRMALSASPKIRPIRVDGDREYYVVFAGVNTFRDLKTNTTITQAQREVTLRNQNNRLFQGGDIEWDGMIIREIPEITGYTGVGASTSDVAPVYLCGAQALGVGFAKRWGSKTETRDYGDKVGVAMRAIYGIEKLTFGSGAGDTDDLKQHGVVTGYFSDVADS
jgi:N4-gp56 family major capsid protein